MQLQSVTILLTQVLFLCEYQKFIFVKALVARGVRDAAEKEFSFVVSIGLPHKLQYVDEKHFCTGTLISRRHVLTAAHCLKNTKHKVQVTIGSVDLRKGRAFFADNWITFDQWARQKWKPYKFHVHEVAIMKLTEEVNETTIVPAKVWRRTNEELYGKNAVLAGWGYTNDVKNISRILKVATVTIPNNKECSRSRDSCSTEPTHLIIHSRFLCSKADPYALISSGDSGGPLIYEKNTIIGVNRGTCPTDETLRPNYAMDIINKRRINLHTSTSFYQYFIDDCLENY